MQTAMIRRLLYAFKRQWGTTFDYIQILTSQVNDRTGNRDISRQYFQLPGVLLPIQTLRKFIQDIGYLAADKNFTYGALNDFNTVRLLISADDKPAGLDFNLNGYITHQGKRYERVELNNMFGECWLLVARGVEGANQYGQLRMPAVSALDLRQKVRYELN
jgi:hypothetical protein